MMKTIKDLHLASTLLKSGGVIAYPTETFYAIGASAYNEEAILRIFEIKQRELSKPLPLIVRDFNQAKEIADIPQNLLSSIEEICTRFWPESLSIVLPAKENISPILTAHTGTVVVRQSPCEVAHFLCKEIDAPLISTSANKSGEKSARLAHEVDSTLLIDAVVDTDYPPKGGAPSTIIEVLSQKQIKILRQGAFDVKKIIELGYSI